MIPESCSFDLVMGKQWWGSNLLVEPNLWTKMIVFICLIENHSTSDTFTLISWTWRFQNSTKKRKRKKTLGENLRSPNHPQTIPKLPHLALLAQTHSPPSPRLFRHNQTHSGDSNSKDGNPKMYISLPKRSEIVWFAAISFWLPFRGNSHTEKSCSPIFLVQISVT